jgi:hypothetical protein
LSRVTASSARKKSLPAAVIFPALIIAKHITAAEDINGWRPSGKAL